MKKLIVISLLAAAGYFLYNNRPVEETKSQSVQIWEEQERPKIGKISRLNGDGTTSVFLDRTED
jgi:hypothetical protein